jgi:hypothetical protein
VQKFYAIKQSARSFLNDVAAGPSPAKMRKQCASRATNRFRQKHTEQKMSAQRVRNSANVLARALLRTDKDSPMAKIQRPEERRHAFP